MKVERIWPEPIGADLLPYFRITPDGSCPAELILERLRNCSFLEVKIGVNGTIIARIEDPIDHRFSVPGIYEIITQQTQRLIQITGTTKRSPHQCICVANFWPDVDQLVILLASGFEVHSREDNGGVYTNAGDYSFALTTSVGDTLPPPQIIARILDAELVE